MPCESGTNWLLSAFIKAQMSSSVNGLTQVSCLHSPNLIFRSWKGTGGGGIGVAVGSGTLAKNDLVTVNCFAPTTRSSGSSPSDKLIKSTGHIGSGTDGLILLIQPHTNLFVPQWSHLGVVCDR